MERNKIKVEGFPIFVFSLRKRLRVTKCGQFELLCGFLKILSIVR